MKKPRKIGIAIANRSEAEKAYQRNQAIFSKGDYTLTITRALEPESLNHNTAFLSSDLIVVFGGDGTLLKVAHAIQTPTPIVHIGCGERNQLATLLQEQIPKALPDILKGNYILETHSRLAITTCAAPLALNEIVIAPQRSATTMHYRLSTTKGKQQEDHADGIVIATPTGSQAYFSSQHNPSISIDAPVIGIAPLNSTSQTASQIVANHQTIIVDKIRAATPIEIIIDGQTRLIAPSRIEIKKAKQPLLLCKLPGPFKMVLNPKTIKLKPSSRFILLSLSVNGNSTALEIQSQTGLTNRTIRRALRELEYQQLIQKKKLDNDHRQQVYRLKHTYHKGTPWQMKSSLQKT